MQKHVVDCSTVILAHNGREFTRHCFNGIVAADDVPRELIVVNNGSTDGTAQLIDEYSLRFADVGIDFTVIAHEENLGCSLARNMGWKRATMPYVVFMDNDAVVCSADYLSTLVERMEAEPELGVLGPKMIYPYLPHTIQCAGCDLSRQGRIRFRGRGQDRFDPEYNEPLIVPVLISACWIMRREFIDTLGGLDEYFHPVQYEDLDFCMRVNQAGFHCAYTPAVEMYHFEGVTTASYGRKVYQRNIAEQSQKFKRRWMDDIRRRPADDYDYRWLRDDELGLDPELTLDLRLVRR